MLKILKNPFYIYPFSFTVVFLLYSLNWSTAFPKLGLTTTVFFALTFIVSIFFGWYFDKSGYIQYHKIELNSSKILGASWALGFILAGVVLEIAVAGESPLISALRGRIGVDYKDFGIKSLHVLLTSFNSFLIVYMFHLFLSTRKKKYLIYYILTFVPAFLIFNRGMILIGLISSFFVFALFLKRKLKLKQIIFVLALGAVVMYVFGYLGNIRSANGDSTYIPQLSGATEDFMESEIPKEFYWTYLYGGSPMANFQENINKTEDVNYNIPLLVVTELTPEVISKRIVALLRIEMIETNKIRKWLTVGTVYSRSYSYAKWLGPIIVFTYFILIVLITVGLVPKKSSYHVSAIALLSTLTFLNTFSNMFVFSGLILPLAYPIIFAYFEKKKFVLK